MFFCLVVVGVDLAFGLVLTLNLIGNQSAGSGRKLYIFSISANTCRSNIICFKSEEFNDCVPYPLL
jgi:hypothetical protein